MVNTTLTVRSRVESVQASHFLFYFISIFKFRLIKIAFSFSFFVLVHVKMSQGSTLAFFFFETRRNWISWNNILVEISTTIVRRQILKVILVISMPDTRIRRIEFKK